MGIRKNHSSDHSIRFQEQQIPAGHRGGIKIYKIYEKEVARIKYSSIQLDSVGIKTRQEFRMGRWCAFNF